MASYLRYVILLRETFPTFELVHVPREKNAWADLLSKLVSSGKEGQQRSPFFDARNVEGAQDKHLWLVGGRVVRSATGRRSGDLDDTIPVLPCWWYAPGRARRSKGDQEEHKKLYPGWRKVVPSWLHSSRPHLCKWGSMYRYHGRAPWRKFWKPRRKESSLPEGRSSRVLLANYEGGLHEVCTTMLAVSEACWLASRTPQEVAINT